MNFDQIEGDKGHVKCPFPNCNTKIIPYNKSLKDSIQIICNSPEMVNVEESEIQLEFFKIKDMWDFDNIGVSRPMEQIENFAVRGNSFNIERLLICSECDKGPIGFAGHFAKDDAANPNNMTYFLSCESMKYQ